MNRIAGLAVVVCIGASALTAQSNDYRLTLGTGDTLSQVTLVSLKSDTLSVLYEGAGRIVTAGSIDEVRRVRKSEVWEKAEEYALIGGISGAVISGIAIAVSAHGGNFYSFGVSNTTAKVFGSILGAVFYGAVCAFLGGTVGAVVGIIKGTDDVYDLSRMPVQGKIITLREIISHQ